MFDRDWTSTLFAMSQIRLVGLSLKIRLSMSTEKTDFLVTQSVMLWRSKDYLCISERRTHIISTPGYSVFQSISLYCFTNRLSVCFERSLDALHLDWGSLEIGKLFWLAQVPWQNSYKRDSFKQSLKAALFEFIGHLWGEEFYIILHQFKVKSCLMHEITLTSSKQGAAVSFCFWSPD